MLAMYFYVSFVLAVVFWNQRSNFTFVDPTKFQDAQINYNAVCMSTRACVRARRNAGPAPAGTVRGRSSPDSRGPPAGTDSAQADRSRPGPARLLACAGRRRCGCQCPVSGSAFRVMTRTGRQTSVDPYCATLSSCWLAMLRLSLYDGNGFNFLQDVMYSESWCNPPPALPHAHTRLMYPDSRRTHPPTHTLERSLTAPLGG